MYDIFGDPTNDPKTPQNAPKLLILAIFCIISGEWRRVLAPRRSKTPKFDYDLYNFREMNKSIN